MLISSAGLIMNSLEHGYRSTQGKLSIYCMEFAPFTTSHSSTTKWQVGHARVKVWDRKVCFPAEKWASTGNAMVALSLWHDLWSFRCQALRDFIQLAQKAQPFGVLITPLDIQGMQNQIHRLILVVFSLKTKNPEIEVILFPFLCFLPFILFVPDLNRGLQRRVRNLVQEVSTKRIRPLLVCSLWL